MMRMDRGLDSVLRGSGGGWTLLYQLMTMDLGGEVDLLCQLRMGLGWRISHQLHNQS